MFRLLMAALAAMGLCGAAGAQPAVAPIRLALIEGLSGPFANAARRWTATCASPSRA